ncbi:MAG: GMC family oxidoreductase N-terminal domain-containing protein, partial [Lautropia sp.]|nr:GMC family oxidoreductase N-terminal domain-containing protein [Lautropia sp.]
FDTVPSEGTGGRNVVWPRGRILGGSSSINGLIYIRGQHQDYDDWARLGARGWDYESVLPYFRRTERFEGGESRYHGACGELGVSELRNDHAYCSAWVQAGQQLGLPFNPDFNADTDYGVGAYQLSIRNGWRSSASRCFLHPVLQRRNLTLVTGAHVSRVLMQGLTAVGVQWLQQGRSHSARADREVILSGGTIQSPQLLQLSGIGPAAVLKKAGVPVVLDLEQVGANLQDHYQARTIVRLKKPMSLNDQVRNPIELARMGLQWLMQNRGPLTVGAGQVGGFARTEHARDSRADMQFNVMPVSVDKPGDSLHRFSGFTASACQCRPLSRGSLEITSADPVAQPRIAPNYFADTHDRKVIVAGLRMLREIYRQPAFRELWAEEVLPGEAAATDAELFDFARHKGGTVFHPVGTCRMGEDDAAVVDSQLRVRGIDRLRVIDASVMPTMVSANTNAAAIMIGEKGADLILNPLPT